MQGRASEECVHNWVPCPAAAAAPKPSQVQGPHLMPHEGHGRLLPLPLLLISRHHQLAMAVAAVAAAAVVVAH